MQKIKDILCVVAPDSTDRAALDRAVALADNNQARLTVVEVIDQLPHNTKLIAHNQSLVELQAKIVAGHWQELKMLVAPWSEKIEIQTQTLIGIPFLEIIREVLRNGHDLVIKTAENAKLLHRIFGNDDMNLLRQCPCSVLLVKLESPKACRRILAAVDVDDNYLPEELNTRYQLNLQVLEMASSLALSEFAELHIVSVWEAVAENMLRGPFSDTSEDNIIAYIKTVEQQHKRNMSVLMDELSGNLGQDALEFLKPNTHLLKGSPREKIPVFAKAIEADLVVMGTVARTGISGFFMGNTAETILDQLDCSVLAVKPQGFKTPVTLET